MKWRWKTFTVCVSNPSRLSTQTDSILGALAFKFNNSENRMENDQYYMQLSNSFLLFMCKPTHACETIWNWFEFLEVSSSDHKLVNQMSYEPETGWRLFPRIVLLVFIEIMHTLKEITLPFNHFNVEQHKDWEKSRKWSEDWTPVFTLAECTWSLLGFHF